MDSPMDSRLNFVTAPFFYNFVMEFIRRFQEDVAWLYFSAFFLPSVCKLTCYSRRIKHLRNSLVCNSTCRRHVPTFTNSHMVSLHAINREFVKSNNLLNL